MPRRDYEARLTDIRNKTVEMGKQTVAFVAAAVDSLCKMDSENARACRQLEKKIDRMYQEIDERCVALIATQQPAAGDLRFIIATLKILAEVERIADYANNIAKRVEKKAAQMRYGSFNGMEQIIIAMATNAGNMLSEALDAYMYSDINTIDEIVEKDKAVNEGNKAIVREMITSSCADPFRQEGTLELYAAVRYLERVADRSTNIAELVFYMVTGYPYKKKK